MAVQVKARIVDKGIRKRQAFVAEMTKYRGAFTEVGIFEDAKDDDGDTVADYANKHEFGIDVPKRPFMRRTFNKHRKEWEAFLGKRQLEIMKGKETVKGALFKLGLIAHTNTKKMIRTGEWGELAKGPYRDEKERMNKNKVLINTGTMHNSITFQVRIGKKTTKATESQTKGKV